MADLTQYTGNSVSSAGGHIISWVGTETQYEAISTVSDSALATYDTTSANFDPAYSSTLYFIHE